MRPIDADELRKAMYHEAFETDSDMQKWDGGCWIRYKMFEKSIDSAPTIEAEPVRCGRWIVDNEFIDCSVCRSEKWSKVPYESLVRGFKYCPKCGAKMLNEDPSHPFADSVMMGD